MKSTAYHHEGSTDDRECEGTEAWGVGAAALPAGHHSILATHLHHGWHALQPTSHHCTCALPGEQISFMKEKTQPGWGRLIDVMAAPALYSKMVCAF